MATNLPWIVDARVLERKLAILHVELTNDLVALAFGALTVPTSKLRVLQVGAPKKRGGNLAILRRHGSRRGRARVDGSRHVPLATEGGHVDFAPRTPIEWELYEWLETRFGHVSYERIAAGPGFSAAYELLPEAKKVPETRENAALVAAATDRNAIVAGSARPRRASRRSSQSISSRASTAPRRETWR